MPRLAPVSGPSGRVVSNPKGTAMSRQPDTDSAYQDPRREPYDPRRTPLTLPLANILGDVLPGLGLPNFAVAGSQRSYASWPVWKDSTTANVRFAPLPKKQAVRLYHKARQFERQTRQPGKQDGALGRNGLAVLHALLFDFLNYTTGRLDPAYKTIARKACLSVRSVARGLASLKLAGVLNWLRRAGETRDESGRFCLEQDTNAYGVLPPSQWLGFLDRPDAPPPHPATWGASPPLPDAITQAAEEMQHGARRTALSILETDPQDELAAALASFWRTVEARKPQ
jgi:hypothetical protein